MDADLKKLSRVELLELMVSLSEDYEKLADENNDLKAKLSVQRLPTTTKVGSIAEAALQMNGYFEVVQQSADEYLREIKHLRDELEKRVELQEVVAVEVKEVSRKAEQLAAEELQQAQAQAGQIMARANAQAEAVLAAARAQADEILASANHRSHAMISEARRQADALVAAAAPAPASAGASPAPAWNPAPSAPAARAAYERTAAAYAQSAPSGGGFWMMPLAAEGLA